jgi:hypothetical protein
MATFLYLFTEPPNDGQPAFFAGETLQGLTVATCERALRTRNHTAVVDLRTLPTRIGREEHRNGRKTRQWDEMVKRKVSGTFGPRRAIPVRALTIM